MNRYEVDVETFYDKYIEYNHDLGFVILLTLVSRNSDNANLYKEIEKKWLDLHDLTGNKVLFAFIGKNHTGRPESICRRGEAFFNRVVSFFGNERQLYGQDIIKGSQYTPIEKLRTIHSAQIREIKKKLSIDESQVPCLHILFIPNRTSRRISLKDLGSVSLYDLIKQLMIRWEPVFKEYEYPLKSRSVVLSKLERSYYCAEYETQQILEKCGKMEDFAQEVTPVINQLEILLQKQILDADDKKNFGQVHKTLKLLGFRNSEIGKLHQYIDLKLTYGNELSDVQGFLAERMESNVREQEYVANLLSKVDDTIYWLTQMKKSKKYKIQKEDETKNLLIDSLKLDSLKTDLIDSISRGNADIIVLLKEQEIRSHQIMAKLDSQYLNLINNIKFAIENKNLSEHELYEILVTLQKSLEQILMLKPEVRSDESIKAVKDTLKSVDLTAAGKVKLTIPIIPALITYESEWSVSGKTSLNGLWGRLKLRFGSDNERKKGL